MQKKSFSDKTTIHGFLDIADAANKYAKYFWVVIIVLAGLATVIEIYFSIRNYLDSPLLTSYMIKTVDDLKIPQVYLCPNTAVDDKKIKHKNQYDFVNGFFNGPPDPDKGGGNILSRKRGNSDYLAPPIANPNIGSNHTENLGGKSGIFVPAGQESLTNFDNDKYTEEESISASSSLESATFDASTAVQTTIHSTTMAPTSTTTPQPLLDPPNNLWQFFEEITISQDDFFTDCAVKNRAANCSAISRPIFDLDFGGCFLLDVGQSQTGPGKGISLIVDSALNQKMVSLVSGITFSVVDTFNPLRASLDKIYIGPQTFNKITLQATKHKQMNVDTGSVRRVCLDTGDSLMHKKFQFANLTNDKWACQLDCALARSYKYCGCIIPFEKSVINKDYWNNVCGYDEYIACLSEMAKNNDTREMETKACISQCIPLCELWTYSHTVNTAPLEFGFQTAVERMNITGKAAEKMMTRFNNQIVLEIAFADLQYTEISQYLSMSADTFLSNIGGQIGLWLGASLLSVIQLAECFISWIVTRLNSHGKVGSAFPSSKSKIKVIRKV